jgi:hypothetical protein
MTDAKKCFERMFRAAIPATTAIPAVHMLLHLKADMQKEPEFAGFRGRLYPPGYCRVILPDGEKR